jgi:hypothetical protein
MISFIKSNLSCCALNFNYGSPPLGSHSLSDLTYWNLQSHLPLVILSRYLHFTIRLNIKLLKANISWVLYSRPPFRLYLFWGHKILIFRLINFISFHTIAIFHWSWQSFIFLCLQSCSGLFLYPVFNCFVKAT